MATDDDKKRPTLYDQHGREIESSSAGSEDDRQIHAHGEPDREGEQDVALDKFFFRIGVLGTLISIITAWAWSRGVGIAAAAASVCLGIASTSLSTRRQVQLSLGVIVAAVVIHALLPPLESRTHGWLRPGFKFRPVTDCPTVPLGSIRVFLGNNSYFVTEADEMCLIRIAGVDVLSVRRRDGELAVDAKIYDDHGLLTRIVDNEFDIDEERPFKIERPDASTLVVEDAQGILALRIEYLNLDSIYVLGNFHVSGHESARVIVEPDVMTSAGLKMGGNCSIAGSVNCAFTTGVPSDED